MDEDLVALRTIRDQHKTEIQNLQSQLTSLTKHKDELQETLERAREEHEQLRRDLQQSEMMVGTFRLKFSSLFTRMRGTGFFCRLHERFPFLAVISLTTR